MAIDRRPNRPKPWRARYWGPDGRQHSRSFTRKADAQRWLAEVAHDKTRGHWTNPALGRVRFSAWVEEWQETTNNVRPTTAVRDRMLLDRYLLPRFGPLPLSSASFLKFGRRRCAVCGALAAGDGPRPMVGRGHSAGPWQPGWRG